VLDDQLLATADEAVLEEQDQIEPELEDVQADEVGEMPDEALNENADVDSETENAEGDERAG
jgi:hypothetical protein